MKTVPNGKYDYFIVSWRGPEKYPNDYGKDDKRRQDRKRYAGKPMHHRKEFRTELLAGNYARQLAKVEDVLELELRGAENLDLLGGGFPCSCLSDKLSF